MKSQFSQLTWQNISQGIITDTFEINEQIFFTATYGLTGLIPGVQMRLAGLWNLFTYRWIAVRNY